MLLAVLVLILALQIKVTGYLVINFTTIPYQYTSQADHIHLVRVGDKDAVSCAGTDTSVTNKGYRVFSD